MKSYEDSLDLAEIPVRLNHKGQIELYVLRELDGQQREQYLDGLRRRMKTDAAGNAIGLSTFEGMHTKLLSMCIYYAEECSGEDEDGQPKLGIRTDPTGKEMLVPEPVMKKWRPKVQEDLFNLARQISALSEAEEGEAKN